MLPQSLTSAGILTCITWPFLAQAISVNNQATTLNVFHTKVVKSDTKIILILQMLHYRPTNIRSSLMLSQLTDSKQKG
jgi:hypothetical protein